MQKTINKETIMKEMKSFSSFHFFHFLYFIIAVLFLFSCVSGQPFYIDVRKPPDVSFPIDIAKILVVDNSVSQPINEGVTQTYEGALIENTNLSCG